MSIILACVGMPGSGKTEATKFFEQKGFHRIYFGGIVVDELKKQKMELNEKNERYMREHLRKVHGMDAMAKLSRMKIDEFLEKGNVIIDGLYSMEEYMFLKNIYKNKLVVVHIYANQKMRIERLTKRKERPLTAEEVMERDVAQIEKLHTGGPIAMADYVAVNEGSLEDLYKELERILKKTA